MIVRTTLISAGVISSFVIAWLIGPEMAKTTYEATSQADATQLQATSSVDTTTLTSLADNRPVVVHQPLPEHVKAIYMSSCVAGTPSFRTDLIELMAATEINSFMIDIKDYSGTLSFAPTASAWQPAWANARCGARDMADLITTLHEAGIFVIGRITVFQDPFHAERHPHLAVTKSDEVTVWKDHKGLAFIDVAAREYWDHIIDLSVDAYNLGFDELNYDYVRYPSDGNMRDIAFPHTAASEWPNDKPANLEAFFAYLYNAMTDPDRFADYRHLTTGRATSTPWLSADLFGMTTTNYDDLSIGQIQERAAPYFDFIAPMVYPSHYPHDYLGLGNPNNHPYRIVHHAMQSGVTRMQATTTRVAGFQHTRLGTSTPAVFSKPSYGPERLRTWIQDFDYGGNYDAAAVRAQIQASYDAGVMSWMLWAPSNRYTKGALKPSGSLDVGPATTTQSLINN